VQPQYPSTARQMKIAGAVEIEAVISHRVMWTARKRSAEIPLLTGRL
jgi:hypothetical protein